MRYKTVLTAGPRMPISQIDHNDSEMSQYPSFQTHRSSVCHFQPNNHAFFDLQTSEVLRAIRYESHKLKRLLRHPHVPGSAQLHSVALRQFALT